MSHETLTFLIDRKLQIILTEYAGIHTSKICLPTLWDKTLGILKLLDHQCYLIRILSTHFGQNRKHKVIVFNNSTSFSEFVFVHVNYIDFSSFLKGSISIWYYFMGNGLNICLFAWLWFNYENIWLNSSTSTALAYLHLLE